MQAFAKWFYENEIKPHFDAEEKYVFTILGEDHELVKRALSEHRSIENLFNDTENPEIALHRLEEELEAHIRFEERILFNEVQNAATDAQLQKIEEIHQSDGEVLSYSDPFWEKE